MTLKQATVITSQESVLSTNRVLRNTYLLLALSLVVSAASAAFAVVTNAPFPGILLFIVGTYGLLFLTSYLRNSPLGLVSVFAFTGFMGYTLGPLINIVLHSYINGGAIVTMSLGATGVIFFALSAYALTTRKDFSYLGGFITAGILIAFIAGLANIFLRLPALDLLVSSAFALLSSGVILFQTSLIINGGERNYIMATINIYVALYNLFISLLRLFSAFSGREN